MRTYPTQTLIYADHICFHYDSQIEPLLKDLSFHIHRDSRIGLIGQNGAGKSTLLKIIQARLKADQGQIHRLPELNIVCLQQDALTHVTGRVIDFIWTARTDLLALRQIFLDPEQDDAQIIAALDHYQSLGGFEFEGLIEKHFKQVGFDDALFEQRIECLSAGQKNRLALFKLLLEQADLLILDEPANHLDTQMMDYLESFLVSTQIPWIMVSHDRYLLETCCESIWELEQGQLTIRHGNYAQFALQKQQQRAYLAEQASVKQRQAQQLQLAAQQRSQIANQMESFKAKRSVRNNGGICKRDDGSGHASVRKQNMMRAAKAAEKRAETALQQAQALQPHHIRVPQFRFEASRLRAPYVLKVHQLSLQRQAKLLFQNLNLEIQPGQRIQIVGPNGAGKSSLLEVLMGVLEPDRGYVQWFRQVEIGYFAQTARPPENPQWHVRDYLWQLGSEKLAFARTLLACLGLSQACLSQSFASLSPGEQTKIRLTCLIARQPDILILDEPTNHLEIGAREALEQALLSYQGALILVSHDRVLCQNLNCQQIVLNA